MLRGLGRYEKALAPLERALELQPDYAWALAHKGEALQRLGRYEEAMAAFDRALELKPDYAWAMMGKGETLLKLGRYEEAMAPLERASRLWSESSWCMYQVGLCHFALDAPQQVTTDLAQAIERAWAILSKEPTDVVARFNLGLYLLATGQVEAARQAYHDALALHLTPHDLRDAHQDLADLQAQMGDLPGLSETVQLIEQAIQAESTEER